MTKQTEILQDEHKIILKVVGVLEKKCLSLKDNEEIDQEFFLKAIEFIRNYADKFHHAKEENILFVEFNKKANSTRCNPVEQMLREHEEGREYVGNMEKGLKNDDVDIIAENGLRYSELLKNHIMKEDSILYPMMDEVFDEKTQEMVTEQAEKIEKEKFEKEFTDKYKAFADSL